MILQRLVPTVVALSSTLDERLTQTIYSRVTSAPASSTSASSSDSSFWNKHANTIIISTVAGTFGLILVLCIILCLVQNIKHKRKEKQQNAQRDLDKANIQILRDKIEEDGIGLNSAARTPPQPPAPIVEPISVFESDDENGPTVLKRTKTFLSKSLKRKERRPKAAEFDRRLVVERGKISPRSSRNIFEDTAWGHNHNVVYEIGVALNENRV